MLLRLTDSARLHMHIVGDGMQTCSFYPRGLSLSEHVGHMSIRYDTS